MANLISICETWRCACGETIRVESFAEVADDGRVLEKDAYALGWKKAPGWVPPAIYSENAMCPDCVNEEE